MVLTLIDHVDEVWPPPTRALLRTPSGVNGHAARPMFTSAATSQVHPRRVLNGGGRSQLLGSLQHSKHINFSLIQPPFGDKDTARCNVLARPLGSWLVTSERACASDTILVSQPSYL